MIRTSPEHHSREQPVLLHVATTAAYNKAHMCKLSFCNCQRGPFLSGFVSPLAFKIAFFRLGAKVNTLGVTRSSLRLAREEQRPGKYS